MDLMVMGSTFFIDILYVFPLFLDPTNDVDNIFDILRDTLYFPIDYCTHQININNKQSLGR